MKTSTVKMYTFRGGHADWEWANVVIDGTLLMIHSSFGAWAHEWPRGGIVGAFVEFLLRADVDYVSKKLSNLYVFDEARTRALISEVIAEMNRHGQLDQDDADDAVRQLAENCSQEELFAAYHHGTAPELCRVLESMDGDFTSRAHDPSLKCFMTEMWPVLKAHLKAELDEKTSFRVIGKGGGNPQHEHPRQKTETP